MLVICNYRCTILGAQFGTERSVDKRTRIVIKFCVTQMNFNCWSFKKVTIPNYAYVSDRNLSLWYR